ncbi:MAG: glycoside hydrolase 100 family protein [Leeuwenhoekiella sp.]
MEAYSKAIQLLTSVASEHGFLASANDVANYKRVWARDGVICGLAGLVDGNAKLIESFKITLESLAAHQHDLGNIPSNVYFGESQTEISFGGLAGRVDTIAWFVIGVCQYAHFTKDTNFLERNREAVEKGLRLLSCWEFNNADLVYVPRSGNWADEYPILGHTLYDQLLRLWALRCFAKVGASDDASAKANRIQKKIELNYKKREGSKDVYHPKAYGSLAVKPYWAATLEPAGYQDQFDAFGNSLALILNLGAAEDTSGLIEFAENTRKELKDKLLPAFWPAIFEGDVQWPFLINNCKYEFRNFPYEFHNGGVWQMVNGFYGLGLVASGEKQLASAVLDHINLLNAKENWSFYENFNAKTSDPNGVPLCSWSAAAAVLLTQALNGKELLR